MTPPRTEAESRRNETEADDFIAPAAARAGQALSYSADVIFMAATQGETLDWERSSDHPLGVRRALRLFEGFRRQLVTSPVLRSRLSAELRRDQIERLDGSIARLRSCLSSIDLGRPCRT